MTTDPTVVLVHGAFAESSSWNDVIRRLDDHAIRSIAAPNELRSLAGDAGVVASLLAAIDGPIVLVGHSYGGAVMTNAVRDGDGVQALVYVAAFAPDTAEGIGELSARLPGSTLGDTLMAVPLPDGTNDLYIRPELYHQQFCADVAADVATRMAATQRPLRDVTLTDRSGDPAWKRLPSWFIIPELDKNIPAAVQRLMAERAGAVDTVEVAGASHAVGSRRPTSSRTSSAPPSSTSVRSGTRGGRRDASPGPAAPHRTGEET
jgi:pimeloyl-ACP methyl ester carboxylesterase